MGVVNSTYYASSMGEQSTDDEEFLPGSQDFMTDSRPQYSTIEHDTHVFQRPKITVEVIDDIEKELETYEKVSLVFLLYDDPATTYECLQNLEQHPNTKVLVEWSQHFMQTDNWQQKLLEGLYLIQNYKILHQLGYQQLEIQERFQENTSVIDKIKQDLYYKCENLTVDQTMKLLSYVKYDFYIKKIKFKEFNAKHLEIYISYWMVIKYISPTDLTIFDRLVQAIQDNINPLPSTSSKDGGRSVEYDNNNEHFIMKEHIQNDKYYSIDPKFPGLCFIINQESFYTEPDESLKSRLSPGHEKNKLRNRIGTQKDCNRLRYTFKKFGFTVKVSNNLIHEEMETEIQKVIQEVSSYSSLIICILTHGTEGAVYGSNSISVDIEYIRNIMCNNPILIDKPKILILQACQGSNLQQLTTDGEGNVQEIIQSNTRRGIISQTCDMLVFYATVPGFASLRSPTQGSWFIQSLCDAILEEAPKEDLLGICTVVQGNVCRKRWKTKKGIIIGMYPVLETTLTKKFYFPKVKDKIEIEF